ILSSLTARAPSSSLFPCTTRFRSRASWGVCALAAAAAFGFTVRSVASHDPLRASVQRSYVKTAFYSLEVASHEKLIPVPATRGRSEEHTSELQSRENLVCRLLLEK